MPRVVTALLLLSCVSFSSASGQADTTKASILEARIRRFELTDQTLTDGIAKLSLQSLPLALGLEEVLREKFADPPPRDPRFSLMLENASVREILDTLCNMDTRYTWSQDEETINVFPRATIGDPTYLLNRKLTRLDMRELPNPFDALWLIADTLPPPKEQVGYAQIGGDPAYAKPLTVTFENPTVRQILNRVAEHMGARSTWIFSGSKDFRTFSFFKHGFHTSTQQQRNGGCPNARVMKRFPRARGL